MKIDADGETGWTALKYAARRLNDVEEQAFEETLAVDQKAREAVAQAVELSHSVAALHAGSDAGNAPLVEPLIMTAKPRLWRQPAAWLAAGLAASVLFMFTQMGGRPTINPEGAAEALSMTWADLHNGSEEVVTVAGSELPGPESVVADEPTNEPTVPDWMLVGVGAK